MNSRDANMYTHVISIPQAKHDFVGGCFYKDDLLFLDNIQGDFLPHSGKEAECCVILFCKKGKIMYDTNGETIHGEQNDILFLTRGQWVSQYKVLSSDYLGQAIFLSPKTLDSFDYGEFSKNSLTHRLRFTNKVKVTSKQMDEFSYIFSMICGKLAQTINYDILTGIKNLTKGILLLALSKKVNPEPEDLTQDELIFQEFTNLVEEKKAQNLRVAEYCKELFVSESRLNKIVHKFTGKTPIKYIHKKLIIHICIIAINTTPKAMSISKIAQRTHFRSNSEFARFVKREINMSLTTFRHLKADAQQNIIHHTTLDQIA